MNETRRMLPMIALAMAVLLIASRPVRATEDAAAVAPDAQTALQGTGQPAVEDTASLGTSPQPAQGAGSTLQPSGLTPEQIELIKPDSVISIGGGYQTDVRPHLGMFDGMRDKGGYFLMDADIYRRDDKTGTWNIANVRNLGLSNREARFEHNYQDHWAASLEFRQIPHDYPYTVTTRLSGIGSATETINGLTSPTSLFLSSKRDIVTTEFLKNLTSTLEFKANFRNEDKNGDRAYGRGNRVGGWLEFLTEPVDRSSRQFETNLNYTTRRIQLSGGYYGSWMTNHEPALNIVGGTDPTPVTGSITFSPLALSPGNMAHQFYVTGGHVFTPTTRGDFRAAYTRATQNADFVDPTALYRNLGGRLDIASLMYGLSSRPTRKLHLVANVRYQDRDDKTPVRAYLSDGEQNQPYSYKRAMGKLEATYLLTRGFSLAGGVDLDWHKRTVPDASNLTASTTDRVVVFRERNNETIFRVQLRRSLSERLNGTVYYLHGARRGSDFLVDAQSQGVSCYASRSAPDLCTATGPVSVFGTVNPVYFADRDRDRVRVLLDWIPFEALSVNLNIEDSKDTYGYSASRPYGLRDGSAQLYSVDATYTLNPNWQVSAWYSYNKTKANQYDQQSNGYSWIAHLTDKATPVGIQLRGNVSSRVRVGADTQWNRDSSEYPVATNPASLGTILLPPSLIQNTITTVRVFAQYGLHRRGDLRVDYRFDKFDTNDWTWMMWNASGNSLTPWQFSDGTFVTFDPRQPASFIAVRYIYRFQ
jgi:MtrB/PioB family decaheme-associated outer membrane protein